MRLLRVLFNYIEKGVVERLKQRLLGSESEELRAVRECGVDELT